MGTSQSDCSDKTFWQSVDKTRSYLNEVVSEIRWSQRLDEFNHSPHFPFLVTHFTDAMPIASIGGALSDVLFNPKYAGNIYRFLPKKVTMNQFWLPVNCISCSQATRPKSRHKSRNPTSVVACVVACAWFVTEVRARCRNWELGTCDKHQIHKKIPGTPIGAARCRK